MKKLKQGFYRKILNSANLLIFNDDSIVSDTRLLETTRLCSQRNRLASQQEILFDTDKETAVFGLLEKDLENWSYMNCYRTILNGQELKLREKRKLYDRDIIKFYSKYTALFLEKYEQGDYKKVSLKNENQIFRLIEEKTQNEVARIFYQSGKWYIKEGQSNAIITVNKKRISSIRKLQVQDIIYISNSMMFFGQNAIIFNKHAFCQDGLKLILEER